jgi:hypothetical protein
MLLQKKHLGIKLFKLSSNLLRLIKINKQKEEGRSRSPFFWNYLEILFWVIRA